MASTVFPAPSAAGKTMYRTTLTSGTSYTVPTGVTYLNVTLVAGGGGGCNSIGTDRVGHPGLPGQVISSTLSATAGASITYAIGAGGAGGAEGGASGGTGGNTTFTGATTATGGNGAIFGSASTATAAGTTANNGGAGQNYFAAGTGGAGKIDIEYWA
jgi:hypothetical protein